MKKVKLLNFLLIFVTVVVVANITIPCIIANAQEQNNNISISNPQNETSASVDAPEVETVKNELQDFKNGLEAITYAQDKLRKRVNYSTSLHADIKISVSVFSFSVELKSSTTVNSSGVVYTVEACNMFEKWLDGQKGFAYYSKLDSNKVYNRETKDVTYDTCVANFSGDYRELTKQQALDEFGYIDNSRAVTITKSNLDREEYFQKTDSGYEMKFRISKGSCDELKQKFQRCAELAEKPSLSKAYITYYMDNYGNITKVHYSLSAYGKKKLEGIGTFGAPIDIEIDQTYSYANTNLIIPVAIEF